MAEALELRTRRLRFVRSTPVIVAVMLAGCTAKPPVETQHPVEQFVYGSGGYYLPSNPPPIPQGWVLCNGGNGYCPPAPPEAVVTPAPSQRLIPRAEASPAPTPPLRFNFPDVAPPAETQTTPEPYRPEPAAPDPQPPPAATYSPPPLRPVDPPDSQPVDPSCGWWRLCNLWNSGS